MKLVFNWWVEEREVFGEEKAWAWLENTLVQILVVVVITKLRTFWTEVENGFRWRAFRSELVDPKRFVKYDKKCDGFFKNPSSNWKGNRSKFLYLAKAVSAAFFWDISCGDAKELWDWGERRE